MDAPLNGKAASTDPRVVIIGAGFGGLAAAIELQRSGHTNYTVIERQADVGGVWQANHYPGARCDVPSIIYQYSYDLRPDWSRRFGNHAEICDYLRDVSKRFGVRPHIRFNTSVESATYNEGSSTWSITLADGEVLDADVMICATGQLSQPKLPDVPGRASFAGAQFHSAEWDESVDLTGKSVAVVGAGASSIQIVPAIAERVGHLSLIQRNPNWVVGKMDWAPSKLEKTLGKRVPLFLRAYHNLIWLYFESRYPLVLNSMNPVRKVWERILRRHIAKVLDNPQKAAACTPDYPLGCNRILLSSEWYETIARPDVSVVRSGVAQVDANGIVCEDGSRVDADVIVWCTGFKATEYIAPMEVTGRDGLNLRDAWSDGPEAYLGLVTPGFPNMFMAYGPNTGSLTNTLVYMFERQADWIRQAIDFISTTGVTLEVREDVNREFNEEIQARFQNMVFTAGCPGWYTTDSGKVTAVWAGSHVEYGRRVAHLDPSVFVRSH
ncbi:MAG: NAD(P)/FAD-dependent oxidoreductase [Solirubrobacterales bacterium]|nr:NAD(P)/FAD-dependent oxidoreductase [Solirubrobacterales bacterium]